MGKLWNNTYDLEFLTKISQNTLIEHLGIEITEIGDDYVVATMSVDHRTIQPMGLLHGGASAALAESMGSFASTMCITDLSKYQPVGIEINASHLRSVSGGLVKAITKPVRIGRKLHVWNTEIFDEQERLICTSRLTVMIVATTA